MPISVVGTPMSLTWANFTVVPSQILDPADGTMVDAYTAFNFNIPNTPTRVIDGQHAVGETFTITITPNARVWSGVVQTPELLSHEEWHYHVGIVTARALAKQLAALRAATLPELGVKFNDAVRLHFTTRAGILQKRYDIDTRHGTQAHYQKIWKDRMTACLANPKADQIGGFYL
jgi:hypothetical protein